MAVVQGRFSALTSISTAIKGKVGKLSVFHDSAVTSVTILKTEQYLMVADMVGQWARIVQQNMESSRCSFAQDYPFSLSIVQGFRPKCGVLITTWRHSRSSWPAHGCQTRSLLFIS